MSRYLNGAVIGAALAVVCAPVNAERLPAKLFAQPPQYSAVAMSPDGRHLAITTPVSNRTDLMIVDLDGKSEPKLVRYQPDEHVLSPIWADDDRLVVGKGRSAGFLAAPRSVGDLTSTNLEGGEQKLLFGYQSDAGGRKGRQKDQGWATVIDRVGAVRGEMLVQFQSWNAKELQGKTYIYRVDAKTASRKLIEKIDLESANVRVDNHDVPRFASSSDEQANPILRYRPTPESEWMPVPSTIAGRDMNVFGFAKDDNVAWAEISDKGEPDVLYRVDFAKGTREKVLAMGDYSTGGVMMAGFDNTPFAVFSFAPRPSVYYLDNTSDWAKLHAGLMKQFPGNLVFFRDFSRDDQRVLVSVASDRNPGRYYIVNRKDNSIAEVLENYEGIDPAAMAQTQVLEFDARDGVKLNALLTVPKEAKTPYPMVVMSHGGPFGITDTWGFNSDVQFLANRGYAVLQVNYRGSGGRGETFVNSGYLQWGGKLMDDIADGVHFVIASKGADKDRICTYGASFGGYAALMNPVRYPELYKCAVGYVGVYDLAYMANKGDIDDTRRGRHYVSVAVGTDPEKLRDQSPVHHVNKLKIPIMLVHGKEDQRVPMIHFNVMEAALKFAGNAPETLLKSGEGHGFYKEENRIELYEKLEAFLDRNIGDKASSKK